MRTCHGGEYVKYEVGEETIDGGGPPVHDTEHLTRLATQVPTETESVQVRKEPNLQKMQAILVRYCVHTYVVIRCLLMFQKMIFTPLVIGHISAILSTQVKVGEITTHLDLPSGILLDLDPEECPELIEHALPAGAAALHSLTH